MEEVLLPILIGIVLIVLGVLNMKGNISSLHWYHRQRVSEEDRIPFGRKVGLGTIIVGCALIIKACTSFAAKMMDLPVLEKAGSVVLVVGLIGGLALMTYAMFKYNKGIF